jgi:hypothetical protein
MPEPWYIDKYWLWYQKNPLKLHDVGLHKQLVVECPLPIMASSNQNNNLFHEGPQKLIKTGLYFR